MAKLKSTYTLYTDRNGNKIEIHQGSYGRGSSVSMVSGENSAKMPISHWLYAVKGDPLADIARLLAMIADAREPDFDEVQAIAKRNGFEFNDAGELTSQS